MFQLVEILTTPLDCLWCGFMWTVYSISRHSDKDLYSSGWLNLFQTLGQLSFSQGTFLLPLFRECLLQAGGMAASRSSLEAVLSKPGGGEAPVLMVGGVLEMMMASKPNEIQLHLSQRKGFVKMAMEVGSTLVPCFVFGETETYDQSGSLAQIWNRLTCSVRNCFGIAPVFFSGIQSFRLLLN